MVPDELKDVSPQSVQKKRLTVLETSTELGVSKQLVYRLFHGGELLGIQVGRAVRIDRDSLDDYIARHKNKGPRDEAPAAPVAVPVPVNPQPRPRRRAARAEVFRFLPR